MKIITVIFILLCSCEVIEEIQAPVNYQLTITAVLSENGLDTLYRDANGFYHLTLNRFKRQTIRRVTGYITLNNKEPFPPERVEWESNLYWWILRGDAVVQVSKTYFNPFTGVLQPVTLPPLIAQKDELVPTVNCCSYSGKNGVINTMIAPVIEMVGDTLIIQAYNYNSKVAFTKIVLE